MDKREVLISDIKRAGFPGNEVAVSIDAFFDGNSDESTIGANVFPHPGMDTFYNSLKKIESSDKCSGALVRIVDIDDGIASDAVYVIGDWSNAEIKEMFADLKPDEIYEGWINGKPANVPDLKGSVFTVWWD